MFTRYPRPDQLLSLVAVAVETGRMTHPHPTGFLGAVTSALFTAYAVQRRPITTWGLGLINEACPIAINFVQRRGFAVEETERDWSYFCDKWQWYETYCIQTSAASINLFHALLSTIEEEMWALWFISCEYHIHTSRCCHKCLVAHQTCINPLLKIVPMFNF